MTTISADTIYGRLPVDLGLIDLNPAEMLFWMYCPISHPGTGDFVPANLQQFNPILTAAYEDDPARYERSFVYLTAKTLWVEGGYIGNRPGWHSDGFGTQDVNYIWSDRAPTEFVEDEYTLPPHCEDSMAIMAERAERSSIIVYPDKHLLKLTPEVIHRAPVGFSAGMRTFVKVSISDDRYNLLGNSVNHALRGWALVPRQAERNHPAQ